MAMKRPAAPLATGAKAPKVAKPAKLSGPIGDVIKGINASDLPKSARSMLEDMLALSLDLCKEKRDRYQSKLVDLVAGVLAGVEEGLESTVEESATLRAESIKDKEELEVQAEAKDSERATKHTDVVAKKRAVAEAAKSFWCAREAVDEAASKVQNLEVEAIAKVEEKEKLSKLLEDFQSHAEGSAIDLIKRIEALGANDSMVVALPAMLSKPAFERGSFDLMVFTSVREWLDKRINETSEAIANAEPTKAANAEALSNTKAALGDACEKQLKDAEAYWKVRSEEEELEGALYKIRKSMRQAGVAARKQQDKNTKSQMALETFQKGPKSAFETLRDKAEEVAAQSDGEAAVEEVVGAAQEPAAETEADAAVE